MSRLARLVRWPFRALGLVFASLAFVCWWIGGGDSDPIEEDGRKADKEGTR